MATQLTRKSMRSFLSADFRPPQIPMRWLLGGVVGCVVLVYASVIAGLSDANHDRDAALLQLADTEALVALPPVQTSALRQQLIDARAALATAEARAAAPSSAELSDDAVADLVRVARAANVQVRGITRIDSAEEERGDKAYNVARVRMSLAGSVPDLTKMLADVEGSGNALVTTLTTLAIEASGEATAEIIFAAFTPAGPEEVAP
ncbi:MAG: hypothetical protein WEC75_13915 [Dehalococcoidia bacterium]